MKTGFLTIVLTIAISITLFASCRSMALNQNRTKTQVQAADDKSRYDNQEDQVDGNLQPVHLSPDKKPTYGDDSVQCITNYFLYRQSLRDWENTGDDFYFEDLVPSWYYVFNHCPGYRINTFINGIKILEHRISKMPEMEKSKVIDTLIMLYDERILYFGNEEYVLGEKATAMVKYCPDKTEEIYDLIKRVILLNKFNTLNHHLIYYIQYAVLMHEADKLSIEDLIDIYLEVDEIAHHNISPDNPSSAEYTDGISRIEQLMVDYLECSVMEDVFRPKYMNDSTNTDLCRKIVALMAYKNCFTQPLFRSALNQLNRLEPTPKLLMIQGRFFANDGNYPEAVNAYRQAVESFGPTEINEKYEAYMKLAEVQFLQKNYSGARSSVLKALEIKPDDARAVLLLADIYLYGAETCGTAIIAKHAGYWAAFDKYQRAKSVTSDAALESRANDGMTNARRKFPTTADLFFNNLKPGQTVTAPCWIGETVVIRASDS